jgi:hypothetical protein
MEHLQYPIGKFDQEQEFSLEKVKIASAYLKDFPAELETLVNTIDTKDYGKIYREGGWNIAQLVHHLADSHINMYVRVKLAITQDNPTITGYDEGVWATLEDNTLPLENSIMILKGIHARICKLVDQFTDADLLRTYYHPGYQKEYTLGKVVVLYAWHSKHHLEHIKIALAS